MGCFCQWESKASIDRLRSDCVHEQAAKRIANVRFTMKGILEEERQGNEMAKEMTRTKSVTADDWSARSKMMTAQNQKLGWGIRVAYASGDVACNVVFGMVGTLLTLFYTDYAGINPGTVGLMMLLSRLFDGFRYSD